MTMAVESGIPRRMLWGDLVLAVFWAAMVMAAAWATPDPSGRGTHTQFGLPPCPSLLLTQRPCPACGLTTSFSALLHADLGFAFRAHALGPPLFAYLGVSALYLASKFAFGYRLLLPRWLILWGNLAVLAAFFLYGIWRYLSPNA